ncbi:MAG: hypothetical protein MRQ07_01240 [Candidatus Midichloria sp.]|nr:hypothetical protein [Candidatus Midichloria sp.]
MSNIEQESFNSEAQENLAGYAANAITAIVTVDLQVLFYKKRAMHVMKMVLIFTSKRDCFQY